MTPELERALAQTGPLVAAWETWTDGADRGLYVFAVGEGKARQLAATRVAEAKRQMTSDDLARRGLRIGAHDPRNEHVWCADAAGFGAWSASAIVCEGAQGGLRIRSRSVARADVAQVVTFVSDDLTERGVRVELKDGGAIEIARDDDPAPLADPTYNRDNLAIDASWARYLGAALASWLGVPHVNQL